MTDAAWIGIDLDGTLAEYHGWAEGKIGPPIPAMVEKVLDLLNAGKNVKIFTARISDGKPETVQAIEEWVVEHIGRLLPVTNVKDFGMIELWDDRCRRVAFNTGEFE